MRAKCLALKLSVHPRFASRNDNHGCLVAKQAMKILEKYKWRPGKDIR